MMMKMTVSGTPVLAVCFLFTILSRSASGFACSTPKSRNVLVVPSSSFKEKTLFLGLCQQRGACSPSPFFTGHHTSGKLSLFASSKTDNNNNNNNNNNNYNNDESSSGFSSSSSPLDRPWQAAVDAAALVTFAAVGKANHHPGDGSVDDLLAVMTTAAPFLLAWFATSPFTNVYSKTEKRSLQESFLQIVPGWAIAVPLGCILRGIIKGYLPPLAFVVVTLIATLVLLGFGRVFYNVIEDVFVELV